MALPGTISFVVKNTTPNDLKVKVRGTFPSLENMMGEYEFVGANSSKKLAITFDRTVLSQSLGYELSCEVQVKTLIFGLEWQELEFRGRPAFRRKAHVLNLAPVNPELDLEIGTTVQKMRDMNVTCELSFLNLGTKEIDATSTTTLS